MPRAAASCGCRFRALLDQSEWRVRTRAFLRQAFPEAMVRFPRNLVESRPRTFYAQVQSFMVIELLGCDYHAVAEVLWRALLAVCGCVG